MRAVAHISGSVTNGAAPGPARGRQCSAPACRRGLACPCHITACRPPHAPMRPPPRPDPHCGLQRPKHSHVRVQRLHRHQVAAHAKSTPCPSSSPSSPPPPPAPEGRPPQQYSGTCGCSGCCCLARCAATTLLPTMSSPYSAPDCCCTAERGEGRVEGRQAGRQRDGPGREGGGTGKAPAVEGARATEATGGRGVSAALGMHGRWMGRKAQVVMPQPAPGGGGGHTKTHNCLRLRLLCGTIRGKGSGLLPPRPRSRTCPAT